MLFESNLNKTDESKIKKLIEDELKKYEKVVVEIVKEQMKKRENKEIMMEVCKKSLLEFYKLLWNRKEFWLDNIKL